MQNSKSVSPNYFSLLDNPTNNIENAMEITQESNWANEVEKQIVPDNQNRKIDNFTQNTQNNIKKVNSG